MLQVVAALVEVGIEDHREGYLTCRVRFYFLPSSTGSVRRQTREMVRNRNFRPRGREGGGGRRRSGAPFPTTVTTPLTRARETFPYTHTTNLRPLC